MGRYEDILNTHWPRPTSRPRMSIEDRAAQFAPFAALTGYDDVLTETVRLTLAAVKIDTQPEVTMTVFYEDARKEGGRFETVTGNLKKIDLYQGGLVLADGREIPFFRICEFEVET